MNDYGRNDDVMSADDIVPLFSSFQVLPASDNWRPWLTAETIGSTLFTIAGTLSFTGATLALMGALYALGLPLGLQCAENFTFWLFSIFCISFCLQGLGLLSAARAAESRFQSHCGWKSPRLEETTTVRVPDQVRAGVVLRWALTNLALLVTDVVPCFHAASMSLRAFMHVISRTRAV